VVVTGAWRGISSSAFGLVLFGLLVNVFYREEVYANLEYGFPMLALVRFSLPVIVHPTRTRPAERKLDRHAKVLLARVYLPRLARTYAVRRFKRRSRPLAR
jgi:hypothetical protein